MTYQQKGSLSGENGEWELRFRLSLSDMKNGNWLEVKTNLPGLLVCDRIFYLRRLLGLGELGRISRIRAGRLAAGG